MTRQILGSKGGSSGASFITKPDTLRSNDSFEILLGLGSGRWKGLTNGIGSLKINGVPMENTDGSSNFEDVSVVFADGNPLEQQLVTFRLGGGGQTQTINTLLTNLNSGSPGPWVSGAVSTLGANFIDIRFVVQQLFYQDEKSLRENTANIEIQMRPSGSGTWINPFAGSVSNTVEYDPDGYLDQSMGYDAYVYLARDMFNSNGTGFSTSSNLTITGKTNSSFVKELRIGVPNTGTYANKSWEVRARLIEKDTVDADKIQERRSIAFESISAVIKEPLGAHPDWDGQVWMQVYGKASAQFSGFPEIEGVFDTKICKTPPVNVFNPDTRQYSGLTWDGSYEEHFTTDPAWQIKEFVEDPIHGLAGLSPGATLDKWDALEASKYYSELVSDGRGGTHPRFNLNLTINEAREVEEMMGFLAGAVNSYTEDVGGGVWRLKVDKPETPIMLFTEDNIFGEFNYSHTDVDSRFNDWRGTFLNEDLDYQTDTVRVHDQANIDLNGTRFTEIALVGCTNEQEALRRLMFRLRVSLNEYKIVTFRTNRVGRYVSPLSTILVADAALNSEELIKSTSRVDTVSGTTVTLKRPVRLEVGVNYTVTFSTTGKQTLTRTITNTAGQRGDVTTLYLDTALPGTVMSDSAIALQATGLGSNPISYRVMGVERSEEDEDEYIITASIIDSGKWSAMDNVSIDLLNSQVSNIAIAAPTAPADGMFNALVYATDLDLKRVLQINWNRPGGAFLDGYEVEYSINDGAWKRLADRVVDSFMEIENPEDGLYKFKIVALDRRGIRSEPLVGQYELLGSRDFKAPTHVRGTVAGIPAEAPYEGFRYTVTDAPVQTTMVWEDDQWKSEVNLVTQGSDIGVENGATVGMTDAEAATVASHSVSINSIIVDVSDLETTYGSTASAAISADAAQQAATDSATARDASLAARDAAIGARNAAQTAQGLAEGAEDGAIAQASLAAGSASTASGFATTASQKADDASGFASAASGSATVANTKAGEASTSAGSAATSESNALGSKNAAATSATVSASTALRTMVRDFTSKGKFHSFDGVGAAVADIPDSYFRNGVYFQTGTGAAYPRNKAYLPFTVGRMYRGHVRARALVANATLVPTFIAEDANLNQLAPGASPLGVVTLTPGEGWVNLVVNWTAVASGWSDSYAVANLGFQTYVAGNASNSEVEISELWFEDVTESGNAAGSASAAANSASSAGTSSTNAGTSASAALTSETNANTAAGNASTYRNEAATSATNAAGSATSASTSAGVSASSATAATNAAGRKWVGDFNSSAVGAFNSAIDPYWKSLEMTSGAFSEVADGFGLPGNTFYLRNILGGGGYSTLESKHYIPSAPNRRWRIKIANLYCSVLSNNCFVNVRIDTLGGSSNYGIGTPTAYFGTTHTVSYTAEYIHSSDQPFKVELVAVNNGAGYADFAVYSIQLDDITESTAANDAATAAATSASTATTQSTAAGNSASAAQTSATNAATSHQGANRAASATLPSDFAHDGKFFTGAYTTFDAYAQDLDSTFNSGITYYNYPNEGRAVVMSSNTLMVAAKGVVALADNRTYRVTIRENIGVVNSLGGNNCYYGYVVFDANGGYLGNYYLGSDYRNSAYGWFTLTNTVTTAQIKGTMPAAAFIRPIALLNYNDSGGTPGTAQLALLKHEDITSEAAAAGSASAASISATNAATSASNASGSASSASTSVTLASNSSNAAQLAARATLPSNFTDVSQWQSAGDWGGSATFDGVTAKTFNGGSVQSVWGMPLSAGQTYRLTIRHRSVSGGGVNYFGVRMNGNNGVAWFPTLANLAVGAQNTWYTTIGEYTADALLAYHDSLATTIRPVALLNYQNGGNGEISELLLENVTSEKASAGSASAANTSASSAGTSATNAGNSATAANNSAIAASTSAGNAGTSASNASNSAVAASNSAAASASSATLSASVNTGALNKSPNFSNNANPTGPATNWDNYDNQPYGTQTRVAGENGSGYAQNVVAPAGLNAVYHAQAITNFSVRAGEWYVIEADFRLNSGTLHGAGIYLGGNFINDNNFFANREAGVLMEAGAVGKVYRFRKLIQATGTGGVYLYYMNQWGGFSSYNAAYGNDITWYRVALRAATQTEIAMHSPQGLEATVQQMAGALASTAGHTTSYWQVQANAGSANAFITAQVSENRPNFSPITLLGENVANAHIAKVGVDIRRIGGNQTSSWGMSAYSQETYTGGAYVSFNGWKNGDSQIMCGLSDAAVTQYYSSDYSAIDYAWHLNTNSSFFYESGNYAGTDGVWFTSDFWEIIYSTAGYGTITYKRNGKVVRFIDGVGNGRTFRLGVGLANFGTVIQNVVFAAAPPSTNSVISMGATEFHVYNPSGGTSWVKAMSVANGNALFHGGLQAGAFIKLGNGDGWPVALKVRDFLVSDGTTVSFGTTLDSVPIVTFKHDNVVALSSGETYNFYADSLTRTGFIARCKISTPGSPVNYGGQSEQGSSFGRQINLTGPPASNGTYTISVNGIVSMYGYPEYL